MPPEDAANFERTLELGKEIAKDLSDSDVLGRWMAHHISDLITRAETVSGAGAAEIRREVANTILDLWNHRATLPSSERPMTAFEPVFSALARLSELQNPWHFYRTFTPGSEPSHADLIGAPMLQFALGLEDAVRDIVQQIVLLAAKEASSHEAKWLKLSEHLIEGDQRRALRSIRLLERELRDEIDRSDIDQDSTWDVADDATRLVFTLRNAEVRIKKIRRALKEHLSQAGNTSPADYDG